MNDQFVVEVSASGLGGVVDDSTSTADFKKGSAFAQENGAYVMVEEADPAMNSESQKLDVSQADLVVDSENDSYYFVFDSDAVSVEAEDEYTATFTLNESSAYIEDEDNVEEVSDSASFVERKVTFDAVTEDADDKKLLVYDLSDNKTVTVSGDSTVAPGTEFSLRVRSDGASPFLKSQQVTVQEDGSFAATFDMSNVEKSTEFTTQARGLSDEINSELNVEKATISASDATAQGTADTVTVDNVKLPQGGFVVVHAEDGSVLGVSDYLEAGQHSDVQVTLEEPLQIGEHSIDVMAHQDDGNSEFDSANADTPYTADGSPVTATATVTVEEPTYTVTVNVENADAAEVTLNGETKTAEGGAVTFEVQDGSYTAQVSADGYQDASADVMVDGADASATVMLEESQTGTQTTTDTPDDNTTDQPGNDDNTSDEKTPGFGIAAALVALAGAALLARRQD
jgi:PGF-CTERM protein